MNNNSIVILNAQGNENKPCLRCLLGLSSDTDDSDSLCVAYTQMLRQLHDDKKVVVDWSGLRSVWTDKHQLLLFVQDAEGHYVSTAQATLIPLLPAWKLECNNVVTLEEYRGQGYGTIAMCTLMRLVKRRWGATRQLTLQLTNHPDKMNAGFYESLGWQQSDTVVWRYILE